MIYEKIAQVEELKNGEKKKFSIKGKDILLVNIEDTFYAVDNKCPHMGGSLVDGTLKDSSIVCPKHGSAFNLKTGEVTGSGKILFVSFNAKNLKTYPIKIEGEDILIGID